MTSNTIKSLFAVLPLAALLLAPSSASAQDDADQELPPGQPVYAPPPPQAAQPVYTAPLSQTTQTTYVPQSVALSGPEEIAETDGRPIPVGYSAVKRTRLGMLIGGGVTFGVSYMYAVMFAAAGSDEARYNSYDGSSGTNEMAALWIPVAGPFIQAAQEDSATGRLLLLGLGAAETVGAVMLYYGLTTKKTVFVRNDLVGSLKLTPMASDSATGMMLSGKF